ncbi:MFS transporter, partial [Bordetella pseudohinzii]
LIIARFLTGLAMGAIVPNAVSLGGEYSPIRLRATLVMMIACGYQVGAMLCGFIAAVILPEFGWRAVLVAGGAASLLLSIAMAVWMPESLQFLALRPERRQEALRRLRQLCPELSIRPDATLSGIPPIIHGGRLAELFHQRYRRNTLLLWSTYFMNLLAVFFLASWLPILLRDAGHSAQQAIFASAALWGGGIVGTLSLGWVIDRFGYGRVLAGVYLLATSGIFATGVFLSQLPLSMLAIAISGFSVMGAQAALNALGATLYPTHIRATGIGWALGMGRLGSVVGPIVGGQLISIYSDSTTLLAAAAIPTCIAMFAVFPIGDRRRASSN